MTTLFISDLHLDNERSGITSLLLGFLESEAREAESIYILGDLFEYWIGDDALTPIATEVARALNNVGKDGTAVYFIHGNRDFLLGREYARSAGMEILEEPCTIDLYGVPTLLLHGDVLCTDDHAYQDFRRMSRDPAWQKQVLMKSVSERISMATSAREESRLHTGAMAEEIMDVNQAAVVDMFRRQNVKSMIHGHTHKACIHQLNVDGEKLQRIVLGDWYEHGSVLRVNPQRYDLAELR